MTQNHSFLCSVQLYKEKTLLNSVSKIIKYRWSDSNRHGLHPHDFESCASANSATPAYDICRSHAIASHIINVILAIKIAVGESNPVSAVRGRRLNRLTNEPFATLLSYTTFKQNASLFLNFFKKIYFSNFKDFLTAECLSILCHPTPCVNVSYIKCI